MGKLNVPKTDDKEKLDRLEEMKDLSKVLDTPEGRRTVWRMLSFCKTFNSVMTGNSNTYYYAGQQDVGHWIMREITECNEDYLFLMMKENKLKGEEKDGGRPKPKRPR